MKSLHTLCKEHDLPKTSVRRYLLAHGFDTSEGLGDDAVAKALKQFKPSAIAPSVSPSVAPTVETAAVVVGNHAITLSAPTMPAQYSLENLRVGNAVSFDDPLAVAASFLQTADILEDAMKNDIANRQARLEATKAAAHSIAEKRQNLQLEARLYQLQTQQLDSSLSAQTAELQSELGKLEQFSAPGAV